MDSIESRLLQVRRRLFTAEDHSGRRLGSVLLVAVSKRRTVEEIKAVHAQGLYDFGESYLQEALPKIASLAGEGVRWHFIGPVQSNKTRQIASHFNWVHSVDNFRIAQRLNDQRPPGLPPLNICIQVSVSSEPTKRGVGLEEAPALLEAISGFNRLRVRGLMALPAMSRVFEEQRKVFRTVRNTQERLLAQGWPLDTLSMGMSLDMEAAIAEGATIVRIGTAIFGPRNHYETS